MRTPGSSSAISPLSSDRRGYIGGTVDGQANAANKHNRSHPRPSVPVRGFRPPRLLSDNRLG